MTASGRSPVGHPQSDPMTESGSGLPQTYVRTNGEMLVTLREIVGEGNARDDAGRIDRGVLPDEVPIGTTLTRTCIGCGADYEWTSREGWQWPTSYCTRKCKRKTAATRLVNLEVVDDAPDGMRLLICAHCDEPFGWVPRPDADGHLTPPIYCKPTHGEAVRLKRRKARRAEVKLVRENRRRTVEEEQRHREEEELTARVMAESAAARELLLTGGRCATCGKIANPTEQAAKDAKRAIEDRAGRTNPVRYYQCDDGWWHWTRMGADLETWRAERMMTTSPASLRHRGRGGWTVPQ